MNGLELSELIPQKDLANVLCQSMRQIMEGSIRAWCGMYIYLSCAIIMKISSLFVSK